MSIPPEVIKPLKASVEVVNGGDILIACDCGEFSTTVKLEWGNSPFWDVFVGQALLVVLGHAEKGHHGAISQEAILLRAEYGKGGRTIMRLPGHVGIRYKSARCR
jgi:hypothetical protein